MMKGFKQGILIFDELWKYFVTKFYTGIVSICDVTTKI